MLTICNIPLTAFKFEPSVEEMAAIIARMNSDSQAVFLSQLSGELNQACGGVFGAQMQLNSVAKHIEQSGHDREWVGGFVKDLAYALGFDLVERGNPLIETIPNEDRANA